MSSGTGIKIVWYSLLWQSLAIPVSFVIYAVTATPTADYTKAEIIQALIVVSIVRVMFIGLQWIPYVLFKRNPTRLLAILGILISSFGIVSSIPAAAILAFVGYIVIYIGLRKEQGLVQD